MFSPTAFINRTNSKKTRGNGTSGETTGSLPVLSIVEFSLFRKGCLQFGKTNCYFSDHPCIRVLSDTLRICSNFHLPVAGSHVIGY